MSKVLGKGALSYLVLALIHFLINLQLPGEYQLPIGWLFGIYFLLFAASSGSVLLVRRFQPESGSAANIFLISSMSKFFVVILFLVLMIKLSAVANRVAIFHFMGPYFIGLLLQTRGFVKHLKK